jgi:hypothetical protein
VPVERWHLIGSMTAVNDLLLFGWSTAVIFEVLAHRAEKWVHFSVSNDAPLED